ncbi:hypothetical protein ACMDCT_00690 [Halomonadaceae bacterium KBTZ08]
MSKWATLGIEQSHDPEVIEAAFEHQLKFADPEASPERYQALVEAYESAMREAGAEPQERGFGVDSDSDSGDQSIRVPEPPSQDAEVQAGRVMTELEAVFANPGWREDLRRWRAQLESERAHKPGVTEVLRFNLFDFLSRQAVPGELPVSEDVLAYLDERLGWRQHRARLEEAFPQERIRLLLDGGADGVGSSHEGASPDTREAGDEGDSLMPKGFGVAVVGWIIAIIVLAMLFSGLR